MGENGVCRSHFTSSLSVCVPRHTWELQLFILLQLMFMSVPASLTVIREVRLSRIWRQKEDTHLGLSGVTSVQTHARFYTIIKYTVYSCRKLKVLYYTFLHNSVSFRHNNYLIQAPHLDLITNGLTRHLPHPSLFQDRKKLQPLFPSSWI